MGADKRRQCTAASACMVRSSPVLELELLQMVPLQRLLLLLQLLLLRSGICGLPLLAQLLLSHRPKSPEGNRSKMLPVVAAVMGFPSNCNRVSVYQTPLGIPPLWLLLLFSDSTPSSLGPMRQGGGGGIPGHVGMFLPLQLLLQQRWHCSTRNSSWK